MHSSTLDDQKKRPLEVKPTFLAPCTVAMMLSLFGAMLVLLVVPFSNVTLGASLFGVLSVSCFYLATGSFRAYYKSVHNLQEQLQSFHIDDAKCLCCSRNHLDSSNSPMVCDREIIVECITNWFGSSENFHECVRSVVFANLSEHLLKSPFPVPKLQMFGGTKHIPLFKQTPMAKCTGVPSGGSYGSSAQGFAKVVLWELSA